MSRTPGQLLKITKKIEVKSKNAEEMTNSTTAGLGIKKALVTKTTYIARWLYHMHLCSMMYLISDLLQHF